MDFIKKPIKNPKESPYLDWIKYGDKKYEGRLQSKIIDWNLSVGTIIQFYDEENPQSFVVVEITSLPLFDDFGMAFDELGSSLIPNKSRKEVVFLYNELFHYDGEKITENMPSKMIIDQGVVAIGFKIICVQ